MNPLGDFLRARRAELPPEPAATGRRRVPGLRREEIAERAGVSIDYYTRIEQGRAGVISVAVLRSVADALVLDPEQRAHLYEMAGHRAGAEPVDHLPGLHAVLGVLTAPAVILDQRLDVHGTNAAFRALGAQPDNMARFVFLDPYARELIVDWPLAARGTLTRLRFHAARHPDDPRLAELLAELDADPWFAAHWPDAEMRGLWGGPGAVRAPTGPYPYELVTLMLPGYADRTLVVFAPA